MQRDEIARWGNTLARYKSVRRQGESVLWESGDRKEEVRRKDWCVGCTDGLDDVGSTPK